MSQNVPPDVPQNLWDDAVAVRPRVAGWQDDAARHDADDPARHDVHEVA